MDPKGNTETGEKVVKIKIKKMSFISQKVKSKNHTIAKKNKEAQNAESTKVATLPNTKTKYKTKSSNQEKPQN